MGFDRNTWAVVFHENAHRKLRRTDRNQFTACVAFVMYSVMIVLWAKAWPTFLRYTGFLSPRSICLILTTTVFVAVEFYLLFENLARRRVVRFIRQLEQHMVKLDQKQAEGSGESSLPIESGVTSAAGIATMAVVLVFFLALLPALRFWYF